MTLCPTCSARLKAPDKAAGRTLLCPGCKNPVTVPASPQTSATPAPATRPAPSAPPSTPSSAPKAKPKPTVTAPVPSTGTTKGAPTNRPPAPVQAGILPGLDEIDIIKDKEEEEVIEDVLPADEESEAEAVMDVEVVDEDGIEELDVVDEGLPARSPRAARQAKLAWSRLLRLRSIHVKVRDSSTWACTLRDGERMIRTAQAVERRDKVKRRTVYSIDLYEGRDADHVGSVSQLDPDDETLHIAGPDDVAIGSFQPVSWQERSTKPVWILDDLDRKHLKIVPEPGAGRCSLQLASGQEVGRLETVAAHEGNPRPGWFSRDGDFYLVFGKQFDDHEQDKLLFLAAALGMDLLYDDPADGED